MDSMKGSENYLGNWGELKKGKFDSEREGDLGSPNTKGLAEGEQTYELTVGAGLIFKIDINRIKNTIPLYIRNDTTDKTKVVIVFSRNQIEDLIELVKKDVEEKSNKEFTKIGGKLEDYKFNNELSKKPGFDESQECMSYKLSGVPVKDEDLASLEADFPLFVKRDPGTKEIVFVFNKEDLADFKGFILEKKGELTPELTKGAASFKKELQEGLDSFLEMKTSKKEIYKEDFKNLENLIAKFQNTFKMLPEKEKKDVQNYLMMAWEDLGEFGGQSELSGCKDAIEKMLEPVQALQIRLEDASRDRKFGSISKLGFTIKTLAESSIEHLTSDEKTFLKEQAEKALDLIKGNAVESQQKWILPQLEKVLGQLN